ncbi:MAG: hypothetical protein AB1515_03460 [Nitrospirota bacterium]
MASFPDREKALFCVRRSADHGNRVRAMTDAPKLAISRLHRRRHPRIDLNLPVEYTVVKGVAPDGAAPRLTR